MSKTERAESPNDIVTTAVGGIRFLTPYLVNLDVRIDNRLRPELRLSRELMIFPRTNLFGEFEYRADFGWTNRSLNENTGRAFRQGGYLGGGNGVLPVTECFADG